MCTKARGYLNLLREYKPELVMFVGFIACGFLYHDMRAYMDAQTKALTEINMRLSQLEQKAAK